MAAVHLPSCLGPDTLQGVRMHSPGQQLLWLLNKVAVEALGAFLFFFSATFYWDYNGEVSDFSECSEIAPFWTFCLVSLSLQGVTLQRRWEEAAAAVTCSWWCFMGSAVSSSCKSTYNDWIWAPPLACSPQAGRRQQPCLCFCPARLTAFLTPPVEHVSFQLQILTSPYQGENCVFLCKESSQAKLNFPFMDYLSVVFLLSTLGSMRYTVDIGETPGEVWHWHRSGWAQGYPQNAREGLVVKGVSDHCSQSP